MSSPFEEDEELEGPELNSTSIENLSQDQIDESARHEQNALAGMAGSLRIFLPEKATRADAIKELSKSVPENEYGLPTFFYRSDRLPFDLSQLTGLDADACVEPLDYEEGYPTFGNGKIFWQQLPHEPLDAFLLFQRYLDQAEETGLRQIQLLAMENNVSLDKAQEWYTEYFWRARARSFDLFQVAADRKRRELRARKLEDNHYKTADALMKQLEPHLQSPDVFKNMDGKQLVEVLRLLINIQRVSNGLPQNGNAGGVPINPDSAASGRQLMEEITKGVQREDGGLGLGGGLADLLKDPKFALEAQSVVLRVRQNNDPNAHKTVKAIEDGA